MLLIMCSVNQGHKRTEPLHFISPRTHCTSDCYSPSTEFINSFGQDLQKRACAVFTMYCIKVVTCGPWRLLDMHVMPNKCLIRSLLKYLNEEEKQKQNKRETVYEVYPQLLGVKYMLFVNQSPLVCGGYKSFDLPARVFSEDGFPQVSDAGCRQHNTTSSSLELLINTEIARTGFTMGTNITLNKPGIDCLYLCCCFSFENFSS